MAENTEVKKHLEKAVQELRKVANNPSGLWCCPFWLNELNEIVAQVNRLALQDTFLEMDRSRE